MLTTVSRLSFTGNGDDAEIDGVIDDRFDDLARSRRLIWTPDIGIALLELGENLRQDVEAGAFIGADYDFSARNALHLGHGAAWSCGVDCLFRVLLE